MNFSAIETNKSIKPPSAIVVRLWLQFTKSTTSSSSHRLPPLRGLGVDCDTYFPALTHRATSVSPLTGLEDT